MLPPVSRFIDNGDPEGRLHLQHGPIDLIIGVDDPALSLSEQSLMRGHAFAAVQARFRTILEELVAELPLLRAKARPAVAGPESAVGQRMMKAVLPFAERHFITPMAAVAGAVADEMLASMQSAFSGGGCPARIYVNNGGDIAVHLGRTAEFRVRMARETGVSLGDFILDGAGPSRGVATSGRGGRSLSMGIADSVTIIAANAAAADAAATIVGNAVDLPGHPQISRARAIDVVDDSDLGERMVVVGCGRLSDEEVSSALSAGAVIAEQLHAEQLVHRAALFLQDQGRLVVMDDMKPLARQC